MYAHAYTYTYIFTYITWENQHFEQHVVYLQKEARELSKKQERKLSERSVFSLSLKGKGLNLGPKGSGGRERGNTWVSSQSGA
jgi:hypothetical protein